MKTDCKQSGLEFHPLNQREVTGRFDSGAITSDGGGLLLREVEKRTGIVERFAACFRDHREGERVEHTVKELVAQRVYALSPICSHLTHGRAVAGAAAVREVVLRLRRDGESPEGTTDVVFAGWRTPR